MEKILKFFIIITKTILVLLVTIISMMFVTYIVEGEISYSEGEMTLMRILYIIFILIAISKHTDDVNNDMESIKRLFLKKAHTGDAISILNDSGLYSVTKKDIKNIPNNAWSEFMHTSFKNDVLTKLGFYKPNLSHFKVSRCKYLDDNKKVVILFKIEMTGLKRIIVRSQRDYDNNTFVHVFYDFLKDYCRYVLGNNFREYGPAVIMRGRGNDEEEN